MSKGLEKAIYKYMSVDCPGYMAFHMGKIPVKPDVLSEEE